MLIIITIIIIIIIKYTYVAQSHIRNKLLTCA